MWQWSAGTESVDNSKQTAAMESDSCFHLYTSRMLISTDDACASCLTPTISTRMLVQRPDLITRTSERYSY